MSVSLQLLHSLPTQAWIVTWYIQTWTAHGYVCNCIYCRHWSCACWDGRHSVLLHIRIQKQVQIYILWPWVKRDKCVIVRTWCRNAYVDHKYSTLLQVTGLFKLELIQFNIACVTLLHLHDALWLWLYPGRATWCTGHFRQITNLYKHFVVSAGHHVYSNWTAEVGGRGESGRWERVGKEGTRRRWDLGRKGMWQRNEWGEQNLQSSFCTKSCCVRSVVFRNQRSPMKVPSLEIETSIYIQHNG